MLRLDDNIEKINGIGEKTAKKYNKLDIYTVKDLIMHFPRTYERYDEIIDIASAGEEQIVTIEGVFRERPKMKSVRNLKIINADLKDKTVQIRVTWFNMPYLAKSLRLGAYYILRGHVTLKNGMRSLTQPVILTKQEYYDKLHKLMPVYSLTEGLTNNNIRKAVRNALDNSVSESEGNYDGHIPEKIRKKYGLIRYRDAISRIHFPKDDNDIAAARDRLVFDEFFEFIYALRKNKNEKIMLKNRIYNKKDMCDSLITELPYELTAAQKKVWGEVSSDMMSGLVMSRMIQGDVGSGKTVIALLALLLNYENGYQGAMMVRTEVLARQHYEECRKYFERYNIRTGLLVGSMTAKQKKDMYGLISSGEIDVVIGTHALIQDKVSFSELGLVITDEQHRFGVKQREHFSAMGKECHTLVMSATPIPRSLAIVLYGSMDLSVIDELPANRLPIKNCVVDNSYRPNAYRFISAQVAMKNQVYIICPMVDINEEFEVENVTEYTENLKSLMPPDFRIESLHGRMKDSAKNEIMQRFADGEIDILVSTTVIEVGINVPNATVMMVENAERFGLAQLHQLRGRVGRGKKQ